MNIEPDIFDYLQTTSLEPHDDYTSEITYKDQKIIWNRLREQDKEIEILNKELEEYKKDFKEANDLALKLITNNQEYVCKSIKDTIDILIEKLQQKENIIKEVREYVNNIKFETKREEKIQDDILEILDKENK